MTLPNEPSAFAKSARQCYNNPTSAERENPTLPNRLDKLTWNFILAVILTDCLIMFFVWYEVWHRSADSPLETALGIGAGLAISLSVGVIYFSHAEVFRVIAERYLERRFNQGKEAGQEEGRKQGRVEGLQEGRQEGRQENQQHTRETLEQAGIELPPEVKEQLFGSSDQKHGDK